MSSDHRSCDWYVLSVIMRLSSWDGSRSDVASVAVSGPTWVRPNRQYVFTALVDLCRPAPALGYEWSVNGTGVASRSNGPRIDLPARLSSDAWYRLTCRIDAGASSVEAELLFYVEEAAVQVQITPTVQSIGPEVFIWFSGSQSF